MEWGCRGRRGQQHSIKEVSFDEVALGTVRSYVNEESGLLFCCLQILLLLLNAGGV